MRIIFDTNAIIYAVKSKFDLFEEFKFWKIIIPKCVLKELELLSKKAEKLSDKKAAILALAVLSKKSFEKPELKGPTDQAILSYAKKIDAAILTNDVELKKLAKKDKIKLFSISRKKILEL
ncbi:MAG: PIN domain-containing protein [Candidatus Nanoarchaeia archaeon]